MPLSIPQAQALQPGDQLTFGTAFSYEIVSVQPLGGGVYLELKRDDGFLTFARETDLDKAVKAEAETPAKEAAVEAVVVAHKTIPVPPKPHTAPHKRSVKS